MVELPRIAGVERTVEKIRLLGFGQHEEIVLHFAQLRRSLLPEGRGHQHGHIAAEPVHAVLREPEAHGVDLPLPHGSVGVVELGRVPLGTTGRPEASRSYQSAGHSVTHRASRAVWLATQSSSTFSPSPCAVDTKRSKSAIVPNSGLTPQ